MTEDVLDAERLQRAKAEAANDALSTANHQISDLVAMLSHDLRTPLTVINGYATHALQSWPVLDDSQRRELMDRVGRAGQSLQELLEDTLVASEFEAGALQPRPRAIQLSAVLRDVLDMLSHPLPGVEVAHLEPLAAVRMDPAHLKQVLSNAVSNAAKYGAPPYRILAAVEPQTVVLRIIDHGPGVPSEFVPHLFERYSRSKEARNGSRTGTGLGLFIARTLLRANGGDITYECEYEGGSTFVLRLPRASRSTEGTDHEVSGFIDGDLPTGKELERSDHTRD